MTDCNPTTFNVRDASLTKSTAMGNGNAAVATSGTVDLQALSTPGARLAQAEILVEAPALLTFETERALVARAAAAAEPRPDGHA
jgi:hypothetical protein